VLRAALPQGERAAAAKRARLTEEGKLFLKRDREGKGGLLALGLDQGDRNLLARLSKSASIGVRSLTGTADEPRLDRFEEEGWVEVGDEVSGQTEGRRLLWALPVADAAPPVWTARQARRRALYERLLAAPEGLALAGLTPAERAGLRGLAREGLVRIEARNPESVHGPLEQPPELNPHQAAALQALVAAVGESRRIWDPERVPGPPRRDSGGEAASVPRVAAFLLQGVTGSGKTEVYLRLIAEARQRGRGALVLVPEIALTPQLAARFRARFGDDVAVLHSGLPVAQRRAAWRRLRAGEVGIALGARSAVFAPVRRLGVVVVDEEHDSSFKQEEGLRYSGRDLALVRAQRA
jgi:primosomal protein N' (replication factor Y)